MPPFPHVKIDCSWRWKLMAVEEDDLGSEQTLKKILQPANAIWENGSGTTKDKIILPGN